MIKKNLKNKKTLSHDHSKIDFSSNMVSKAYYKEEKFGPKIVQNSLAGTAYYGFGSSTS